MPSAHVLQALRERSAEIILHSPPAARALRRVYRMAGHPPPCAGVRRGCMREHYTVPTRSGAHTCARQKERRPVSNRPPRRSCLKGYTACMPVGARFRSASPASVHEFESRITSQVSGPHLSSRRCSCAAAELFILQRPEGTHTDQWGQVSTGGGDATGPGADKRRSPRRAKCIGNDHSARPHFLGWNFLTCCGVLSATCLSETPCTTV